MLGPAGPPGARGWPQDAVRSGGEAVQVRLVPQALPRHARRVSRAEARSAGVQVPHHEAVGSVDNDDLSIPRPPSEAVSARTLREEGSDSCAKAA